MTLRRGYALAALALLLVELAIALWVHDRWLRPVGGDVLAVLLVHCGLRAVTPLGVVPATLAAVAVGFAVEFAQALQLLERLGLAATPSFAPSPAASSTWATSSPMASAARSRC